MRRRILLTGVLLSAVVSVGRAAQLGILDGAAWRAAALGQQGDTITLPAVRGTIYDRDGVPLATSAEVYSVAIAPREIDDRDRVAALLREHLGMTPRDAARAVDRERAWVVLPGRYGAEVREALDHVAGVHFQSVVQRFYPNGALVRELLGPVRLDGVAQGGLELEFDSILNGRTGRAVVRRDAHGRVLPGVMMRAVEPTPGRDLYLTIDYDLQEIADHALAEAITHWSAAGGELLMLEPNTGEILATVSRGRDGRARNWRAATQPYEPGSTLKPFTVAALLSHRRARLSDSVYAENGEYLLHGRTLRDVHPMGWTTLAEALRESSNIGIAKVAARLEPREQYVTLRDFGFGTATGATYPSESGGRLYRPAQWSKMSQASMAIGYEISVTPLQLALAYGALANGGLLLEPHVVREVRSRDGRVERSVTPRVVRRVISADIAAEIREVLVGAVEDGTGHGAALGAFTLAGKTGTVRMVENGRYKPGAYTASFAGYFPAEDPQLVMLVKLDEPQGAYYGGATAAPVTRELLEAALATRSSPLDRMLMAKTAAVPPAPALARTVSSARQMIALDRPQVNSTAAAASVHTVPAVAGMSMRDGVRRLHTAGFRLRIEGSGRVLRTIPDAGTAAASDAVIRVIGAGAA
ncbi:MAG TPA: penicillin-binding transpeptidase domain-containing protein [Longimicrobiales bacterium]|nr:penicillin-binding transpeptidase domain-containing protein [Longimicrobiales bacterium]